MTQFRVGVVVTDIVCSQYIHDTLKQLNDDGNIEVVIMKEAVLTKTNGSRRASVRLKAIGITENIEHRVISRMKRSIRAHYAAKPLETHEYDELIELHPAFAAGHDALQYSDAELRKLKDADLDIIIDTTHDGMARPKMTGVSRLGITSIHYGDDRLPQNGRPGFWEVYKRQPSTRFSIQLQDSTHSERRTLHTGEVTTRRTYIENVAHVYREGNAFLGLVTIGLLKEDKSIKIEENYPNIEPVPQHPTVWQTAKYAASSAALYGGMLVNRKLLHRDQRWNVAYARKFWKEADLSTAKIVPNLKSRYFADPYSFKHNGKHYIFVEDYDFRTSLGSISCIEIDENDNHKVHEHIIAEPFHMSFPFVFEEDGEILMMPEIHQSGTIRLYRCVEFPHKWEVDYELMKGVSAADTMLIKHDGKWFMLTNINQFASDDHLSQMHAFWADSLKTREWHGLSTLPVVNSSLIGRNAGLLYDRNGDWYRVRQRQGFNRYGAGFSIAKITRLDTGGYAEETVMNVKPVFFDHLVGTHHMHGIDDFTVFDFARHERYS